MRRWFVPLLASAAFVAAPAHAQQSAPAPQIAQQAAGAILTETQRNGYAAVFAAIRASNWIDALAGLETLSDGPLHDVARAELYLAKGSPKATLEQLNNLLGRAPELPQAAQLARLAQTRGATEEPLLPATQRLVWQGGQPRRGRASATRKDQVAAELEALVQPFIRDNQPLAAEQYLIEREYWLAPEVLTEFQQRIGWSYYIVGDDVSARRLADKAGAGVGEWALQAQWLGGLAAWRMNDCNRAAALFAGVGANAGDVELSAAGHYWAARADMMCGRPHYVEARLRHAARHSETFYGLLAHSALGIRTPPNQLHNYHDAEWRKIEDRPNVKTVLALMEIGEAGLADELIKHQARIDPRDHDALLHLACDLNLAATQYWLAHNAPQGKRVNMAARYPTPGWNPTHGWRVDPPLVFAHMLKESDFRTHIVSSAGAVGLMQVRPGAASDVARARGQAFDPRQLTNPSANIEFGQSHLEFLRDLKSTQGLLPKVIAAYNAGSEPVSEWNARAFDRGDPLLYIESLPYWETRGYVPIVLRNYWIYEQATGRNHSNSRDALVQGLWPRFPGMRGATAVRITPSSYAASRANGAPQASGSQ